MALWKVSTPDNANNHLRLCGGRLSVEPDIVHWVVLRALMSASIQEAQEDLTVA